MVIGIPDYLNLDASGEVRAAAERMEARAREAASAEMFRHLVLPLLRPTAQRILEVGCGTGALARRVREAAPESAIRAIDKSEGMLRVARALAGSGSTIEFAQWDVSDEEAWPLDDDAFDLILSSVVVPYLTDEQTESLVVRLVRRLAPAGTLAFIEQDLLTDSLNAPSFELFQRIEGKDQRALKKTVCLGLRPLLRNAGLTLLPRTSFLWTDDDYGSYVRDICERTARDAVELGRISEEECRVWLACLDALARSGDFYYGLVYHRIAGTKGPA